MSVNIQGIYINDQWWEGGGEMMAGGSEGGRVKEEGVRVEGLRVKGVRLEGGGRGIGWGWVILNYNWEERSHLSI